MTLRLQINIIVGALTLLFVSVLIGLELRGARDSVSEETAAANRVAAQLLDRTAWRYAAQGTPAMLTYLQDLGRVRSNDILLFDASNREIYRSPPSPYKAGRDAPAWFSRLISPKPSMRSIAFPDGRMEVHANASRAVLDAWDGLAWLVGGALALLTLVNGLVAWGVARSVRPLGRIVEALDSLQAGRFDVALPPLPGREAAAIGHAFNRMTAQLRQNIETERRAILAEQGLKDQRELAQWMEHHIERERRLIARELHDELGQSVTAMRSMALSIAQRSADSDASSAHAARLIADEASRLYDAMHGIIPRLAPLVLDRFGLTEALADLAERTRRAHPALDLQMQLSLNNDPIDPDRALTLFRTAQEGITNALRHGAASQVAVEVAASDESLTLTVSDNGRGVTACTDGDERGSADHYGLRWLSERAQDLGGRLELAGHEAGGAQLRLRIPRLPTPVQGTTLYAVTTAQASTMGPEAAP